MADLARIVALVQDAMDRFDDPDTTLASLVRSCYRIASLRGDVANMTWLEMESRDLTLKVDGERQKSFARAMLDELPVEDQAAARSKFEMLLARRRTEGSDGVYAESIEQAEIALAMLRDEDALASRIPDGMHPQDLGLRLIAIDRQRAGYIEGRRSFERMLAATRSALWNFLIETEYRLTFGEASAETFERLRRYVDQQLTGISSDALGQFQSAYRRLRESDPEARAQALTTCRRILKTLADDLYPPSDPVRLADGRTVALTDSHFINRLLQFVSDATGAHGNGSVVRAAVEDLGRRLKPLNDLASKGVHGNVEDYEVDTCVVQTYLVVADLLRIRERSALTEGGAPHAEDTDEGSRVQP